MTRIQALFAAALLALTGGAAAAAPEGPVVVELFTSQGCSSCPPADALLGELARRPQVLALALHVTYWNDLGWQDRFSQERFDQRQRVYSRQLGLSSIYTPQMVVNGTRDVVGSQRRAVDRVLAGAARTVAIGLRAEGERITVTLPALGRCDCVLTLFGLTSKLRTPVGRGENAGRTLEEFQVVRAMLPLGEWRGEARDIPIPRSKLPLEANAFAVLAQDRTTGRIIAAGR